MYDYKIMTSEMWDSLEDFVCDVSEQLALALIPDSICPVCDCIERDPNKDCPICGYGNP